MRGRLLGVVVCAVLCGVGASAALAQTRATLDVDRSCSIAVHMEVDGEPLADGSLTLRQVAGVADGSAGLELDLLYDYAASGVELGDGSDDGDTAEKLALYAEAEKLAGTVLDVGTDGVATFEDLDVGAYLVTQSQDEAASGYYAVHAFLVVVPLEDNGTYVYDVEASPKTQPLDEVDEGPSDPAASDPAASDASGEVSGDSAQPEDLQDEAAGEPTPAPVTSASSDDIARTADTGASAALPALCGSIALLGAAGLLAMRRRLAQA